MSCRATSWRPALSAVSPISRGLKRYDASRMSSMTGALGSSPGVVWFAHSLFVFATGTRPPLPPLAARRASARRRFSSCWRRFSYCWRSFSRCLRARSASLSALVESLSAFMRLAKARPASELGSGPYRRTVRGQSDVPTDPASLPSQCSERSSMYLDYFSAILRGMCPICCLLTLPMRMTFESYGFPDSLRTRITSPSQAKPR
jgi:hypothetical protein